MEVVNALARNTIDLKRADLILKALWIAVKNSRRSRFDIWASRMVTEIPEYPVPPKPLPLTRTEANAEIESASSAQLPPQPTPDVNAKKPPKSAGKADKTVRPTRKAAI
jgi:hypothetical protein